MKRSVWRSDWLQSPSRSRDSITQSRCRRSNTNDRCTAATSWSALDAIPLRRHNHPTTGWTRSTPSPFRFVERNYNVIVAQTQSTVGNLVASDPNNNNQPYIIEQFPPPLRPARQTGPPPIRSPPSRMPKPRRQRLLRAKTLGLDRRHHLGPGQHLFGQGTSALSLLTTGGGYVPLPDARLSRDQSVLQNTVTLASIRGRRIQHHRDDGHGILGRWRLERLAARLDLRLHRRRRDPSHQFVGDRHDPQCTNRLRGRQRHRL